MTQCPVHLARRAILAAILALAGASAHVRAQEPAACQKLVAENSPAMVMVKFVLKMSMGHMGDQENETEVPGTMISPEGLVLCSNTRLGGIAALIGRFTGQSFSSKPTDIKILIGDDNEGVEAEFVARDTELDLAWIRIKKPGDRKYACLDLGKTARPVVGDPILCVDKMDKYFDRLTIVSQGHIAGITRKPRELYVPTGGAVTDVGVPVFNRSGVLLGIAVMQMPDADEVDANPMSMMSRMAGMSGTGGMILPATEVAKATKRALDTASSRPSEERQATTKTAAAMKKAKAVPDQE